MTQVAQTPPPPGRATSSQVRMPVQDEAQARFWACEVGKQDFAANFELSLDHHQQLPMRLHFR